MVQQKHVKTTRISAKFSANDFKIASSSFVGVRNSKQQEQVFPDLESLLADGFRLFKWDGMYGKFWPACIRLAH